MTKKTSKGLTSEIQGIEMVNKHVLASEFIPTHLISRFQSVMLLITTPIGEVVIFLRSDKSWFSHLPSCVFKNSQTLCTLKILAVPPKCLKNSHNTLSSAKMKFSRIHIISRIYTRWWKHPHNFKIKKNK